LTREEKFGKEGLTFDDVLLIPARSDILPTQVSTKTRLTNEISLDIPILSAAMDTVTEARMAIALGRLGGLGVVHRNFSIDDQVAVLAEVKAAGVLAAAAVGVSADADERASALVGAGADVIVVDIAHGHSAGVVRMVEKLKARHRVQVVAGNVVTAEGTEELVAAGADCVKVGVGPGAICTTRVVAGAGMPQITAIFDCAEVADRHGIPVCADGGIQESGDIAKAIGAGASTVMLGGLLAGVDESPGEVERTPNGPVKRYRGMGSLGAMQARRSRDRYGQAEVGDFSKLVPEGVEGHVTAVGPLAPFVHQLVGGLRAGMKYVGAATIDELRERARFVRISGAGLRESHPHDIRITAEAPNYRVRA
jgi:IMP dehydrogenase